MTTPTIADQIHAFIRDEILCGQDAGLSPTTPLLELGILDSFALLKLVAHFNGAYAIDVRPDEITGQDFRTIEAIDRLLTCRIASTRGLAHAAGGRALEGPAVFEAPACAQLFVLFTGLGFHLATGRHVVNWPVSAFFTQSALTERNLIVFGDPHGQSYRSGVSAALPTPAKMCEWLRQWIDQRSHIEEIYCIGISAGGPIAMMAGEYLEAATVWAFGPRAVQREFVDLPHVLVGIVEAATGKTLAQLEQEMTDEDRHRIDAVCTPDVVDQYYRNYLDPDTVLDRAHLAELAVTLSHPNGVTRHEILYCPRDPCDTEVVKVLRGCPTVTIVEVAPPSAPAQPWTFSRWLPSPDWLMRHHTVADLLLKRGQLAGLFPLFRAVAGAAVASISRTGPLR